MNSRSLSDKENSVRKDLTRNIKAKALRLGFSHVGVARADVVDDETSGYFRKWIASGKHAGMDYLANNTDKRLDPRLLMDGAKSILCVALNYHPDQLLGAEQYQFAYYAYGKDYHDVMKSKLHQLASDIGMVHYRAFCDTAPILERYWAVKAGLGWIGRNRQLIIPHAGSFFFLGEIFSDMELICDSEQKSRCGNCHLCEEACPTAALQSAHDFDASRCLSYQTIENKGSIPEQYRKEMKEVIYGCDRCQKACPWNRFSSPTKIPELQPTGEFMSMTKQQMEMLSEDDYRRLFKGSAVKRAKYSGLMRNIGKRHD